MSVITNRVKEGIEEFHRRPLEDRYVYLYLDGIRITIKGTDEKGREYVLLVAYGGERKSSILSR